MVIKRVIIHQTIADNHNIAYWTIMSGTGIKSASRYEKFIGYLPALSISMTVSIFVSEEKKCFPIFQQVLLQKFIGGKKVLIDSRKHKIDQFAVFRLFAFNCDATLGERR